MTTLEKLDTAVSTLREFVEEPVESKHDVAGVLQGFSTSFELVWKALLVAVNAMGYAQKGRRPVLQAALQAGLIPVELAETWVLIEDRNLVAHTYRPEMALDLVGRIAARHLPAMEQVTECLRTLQIQGGV